ncbi:uncharacterized protein LOC111050964 [Nilaparvata lugens]|uniref:uncharacterized protein LOC111050964 n=1 Tax=Nilaparvata lugens TaxID=108931 RepID=UPI00193DC7BB|nr:uncharacterized protein LOC111050964 [Nilaparvata lugens]
MNSKFKAPVNQEDTEQVPITRIEAYCTHKFCYNPYFPCRRDSPGPTTYNPKLPRKHIPEADFSKLTPRKPDVAPSYSVGPTTYNTQKYKSMKPIIETHNVKVKRDAAIPKGFYDARRSTNDYIYSHKYDKSLLTTIINPSENKFKRLVMEKDLIRTSEEAAIVEPGEREAVVKMRQLVVKTFPRKPAVIYGAPVY